MSGIFSAFDISARGLSIQRTKMNTVAKNIANAETTETEKGGPYRRERVVVKEDPTEGTFASYIKRADVNLARTDTKHMYNRIQTDTDKVKLPDVEAKVVEDPDTSYKLVYDPSHPDADEQGYVKYPDIEVVNEMVDMMSASRAYEANTVAISAAKKMAQDALDI